MTKGRLYKSRKNKVVGGVCGGLGEYFGIDPIIVRLVFLGLLISGPGLLVYLLAWIFVPVKQ